MSHVKMTLIFLQAFRCVMAVTKDITGECWPG